MAANREAVDEKVPEKSTTTTRGAPLYQELKVESKEDEVPTYKDDDQEYKDEASQQKPYKEEKPAYLPPSYKEEKEEEYRAPVYKESTEKPRTEHYKPLSTTVNPPINYHTMEDYVAPETEFRPPETPYYYGPKVIPKESYKPSYTTAKYYDPSPATTYRPTPGNEAYYEILRPFQQKVKPVAITEKTYLPTSPKYQEQTTKAYESPKYLPPLPPVSDSQSTNYESRPKYDILRPLYQQPQSAKSVYYEPPVTTTVKYESTTKSQVKKYQLPPSRRPDTPNRYVEAPQQQQPLYEDKKEVYEAPKRYVEPPTYALPIVTYKPPLESYPVAPPTTTPSYKEVEADSYKEELKNVPYSADTYQISETPQNAYEEPPRKTEDASYYPAPATASPKKRYPVIIGRYQVADSEVFQPKKVSEGSHVHGANGEEYVVYYLPYGQPLPVPIRRRKRNAPVERRRASFATGGTRHRYRAQRLLQPEDPVRIYLDELYIG